MDCYMGFASRTSVASNPRSLILSTRLCVFARHHGSLKSPVFVRLDHVASVIEHARLAVGLHRLG